MRALLLFPLAALLQPALFAAFCIQGIKWIRTKEASPERNLEVVRLGQPDMLRKLEKALESGCVFSVVTPENPVRTCEDHQI